MTAKDNKVATFIHWAARLAGIGAIAFISLFALDVFVANEPWYRIALALFMHLLPSMVLLAVLALAWRYELPGGILFLVVALVPFALLRNALWVNLLLAAPFALTGGLFLLSWWLRRRHAAQ